MKKILSITIALLSVSFLSAQTIINDWQFNSGTTPTTTPNSSSQTNAFDWRSDEPGMSVSGGNLVISGASGTNTGGYNGTFGTFTPYIDLVNPDVVSYEISFSSWDFTALDGTGADRTFFFTTQDFDGSSSNNWARVGVQYQTATNDVRITADAGNTFRTLANELDLNDSTGYTVTVDVDLTNEELQYSLNGTPFFSVTPATDSDAGSRQNNFVNHTIVRDSGFNSSPEPSVVLNVDYITSSYTVIPEPSTFILVGVSVLALLVFKRKS